jgi:YidC/Oxa1 family membrane protein insertase
MNIFHTLVFQPVYNLIIFLVDIFPGADFGLAIIVATVLIKFVFLPLSKKQIESQKQMAEIQPKIKEIQEKYKDDKERQSKEIMAFYKESGVNPLMGCLPLIVQIIFLIAIYRVILDISASGFTPEDAELYAFVGNPGALEQTFWGVDLAAPSIVFAILAAAGQFYQTKMLTAKQKKEPKPETNKKDEGKEPDFAGMMQKQMLYIGPFMTLFIGLQFPAALSLYWLVSTIFSIGQQWVILGKKQTKRPESGHAEEETIKEAEIVEEPVTPSLQPAVKNPKRKGKKHKKKKYSHR